MQLAVEPLRERELLVVGEALVAEDEDGELVHAGPDLGERVGVVDGAQIDGPDLRGEGGVELIERERHGGGLRMDSDARYWITECGVATNRVTLICSRSIKVGTRGAISFFQ